MFDNKQKSTFSGNFVITGSLFNFNQKSSVFIKQAQVLCFSLVKLTFLVLMGLYCGRKITFLLAQPFCRCYDTQHNSYAGYQSSYVKVSWPPVCTKSQIIVFLFSEFLKWRFSDRPGGCLRLFSRHFEKKPDKEPIGGNFQNWFLNGVSQTLLDFFVQYRGA